ncbi:hypothetical protein F5I97DRAFT_776624 [Phlebopus sp. FC_14]|nr:hypothetical protein F5I97DRAFT_776624 [Phlebopus sp. FC_14]
MACCRSDAKSLIIISVQVDEDSTLRMIRAFTQSEIDAGNIRIEDRVLEVDEMELRRPVRYFWSIQDFVQGLRGALLGHLYLVEINILHRDVSENNVVLACSPYQPRGAIIDFDMAIRYEEPGELLKSLPTNRARMFDAASRETSEMSQRGVFKAERTGTTPYMAINVLNAIEHTHYDDVESFFYVLLLFFFSYNGPLPKDELKDAHDRGFTQVLGSGCAKNARDWPAMFLRWSTSMTDAAQSKFMLLSRTQSVMFVEGMIQELRNIWGPSYMAVGALVGAFLDLFQDRPLDNRVTHKQFIEVLDQWLKDFSKPVDGYNSCPFSDGAGGQLV